MNKKKWKALTCLFLLMGTLHCLTASFKPKDNEYLILGLKPPKDKEKRKEFKDTFTTLFEGGKYIFIYRDKDLSFLIMKKKMLRPDDKLGFNIKTFLERFQNLLAIKSNQTIKKGLILHLQVRKTNILYGGPKQWSGEDIISSIHDKKITPFFNLDNQLYRFENEKYDSFKKAKDEVKKTINKNFLKKKLFSKKKPLNESFYFIEFNSIELSDPGNQSLPSVNITYTNSIENEDDYPLTSIPQKYCKLKVDDKKPEINNNDDKTPDVVDVEKDNTSKEQKLKSYRGTYNDECVVLGFSTPESMQQKKVFNETFIGLFSDKNYTFIQGNDDLSFLIMKSKILRPLDKSGFNVKSFLQNFQELLVNRSYRTTGKGLSMHLQVRKTNSSEQWRGEDIISSIHDNQISPFFNLEKQTYNTVKEAEATIQSLLQENKKLDDSFYFIGLNSIQLFNGKSGGRPTVNITYTNSIENENDYPLTSIPQKYCELEVDDKKPEMNNNDDKTPDVVVEEPGNTLDQESEMNNNDDKTPDVVVEEPGNTLDQESEMNNNDDKTGDVVVEEPGNTLDQEAEMNNNDDKTGDVVVEEPGNTLDQESEMNNNDDKTGDVVVEEIVDSALKNENSSISRKDVGFLLGTVGTISLFGLIFYVFGKKITPKAKHNK